MPLTRIDTLQQFDELRPIWEEIYAADPHTNFFVSWTWLRGFFESTRLPWLVLAFQPSKASTYTAFLPLSLDDRKTSHERELRLGSAPLADYSGFLCLPEDEEEALTSFATYIKKELAWDRFSMKHVLDPRIGRFLACFTEKQFSIEPPSRMSCLYIPLPESWEMYWEGCLSHHTRKNLRQKTRRVETLDGNRITHVSAGEFDRHVAIVLEFWEQQWGRKASVFPVFFRRCFENEQLALMILWNFDVPLAARAAFIDRTKKIYYSFISGYNHEYAPLSPGKFLMIHTIRYAIENGMQTYDFLRGDEDYKLSFGVKERYTNSHLIEQKRFTRTLELGAVRVWNDMHKITRRITHR